MDWKDVTESFTEKQRNYNGKYLEISEVYDDIIEVSLFSAKEDLYEIYISYGIMYGIIYVEKEKAYSLREEIKKIFAEEYKINKEPTGDFIDDFCKKYKVCLPNDIFFNANALFDMF